MRNICVVTGSRADYGLLYSPMKLIEAADDMNLQLVVTGMHLAPEFGLTATKIEEDGFFISAKIETLLSSDTAVGIAKSMGLGVMGFGDYYAMNSPDLVMLLGDRFEILAAANAALIAGLPIAHLCGGDLTEGAYDDAIRHAITKMAHLHFVTNAKAATRVCQMGEAADRVFNVGSTGLDFIRTFTPIDRASLARDLGLSEEKPWILATFHPVTLDLGHGYEQVNALLHALGKMIEKGFDAIITQPNSDNEGRALTQQIRAWTRQKAGAHLFSSLGSERYLSCMKHAKMIVGNSSSGLYEAPSFGKPTVNIGSRQAGRLRPASVIDCAAEANAILTAMERAQTLDCTNVINPYGDGHSSERIIEVIRQLPDLASLVVKRFAEMETAND